MTQGSLEPQETVHIARQTGQCDPGHRGTGSAICLKRSVATRRYAEVDVRISMTEDVSDEFRWRAEFHLPAGVRVSQTWLPR